MNVKQKWIAFRRTADVRSVGYSELFVLSREDVLSALTDHPEAEVCAIILIMLYDSYEQLRLTFFNYTNIYCSLLWLINSIKYYQSNTVLCCIFYIEKTVTIVYKTN